MPDITILFSAAGRRNQLMDCFREAAQNLGIRARILAADMHPQMSPACHSADAAFAVPRCLHEDFHPRIQAICRENSVNLLIPTIDTELLGYAKRAVEYRALGVHINVSDANVIELARDKFAFHNFLSDAGLPAPKTGKTDALNAANPAADLSFPCIFKPRDGSRSIGIFRAANALELPPQTTLQDPNYIWQELWRGREFTIHFYISSDAQVHPHIIPCERLEVRDGEVSKGITRDIPELVNSARHLAQSLATRGARGVCCAQAILRPDGQHIFFELNARFGGGFPLAHHAGAPFAKLLLQAALNRSTATSANAANANAVADTANDSAAAVPPWQPDFVMLRYDAAHFFRS